MPEADLVIYNVGEAFVPSSAPVVSESQALGLVRKDVEVAIRDGTIVYVGQRGVVRGTYRARAELDASGRLLTPGLVDMHTHALFAGSRDDELVERLRGVPYSLILERGGGIYRTVTETRKRSSNELAAILVRRLEAMLYTGTTAVEVKTGYGLELGEELRQLDVILKASSMTRTTLVPTLLAHVPPAEVRDEVARRREYVRAFANELVPKAVGKALFVDVFCDKGAFTPDETRLILSAAKAAGLGLRMHADQLARIGCTKVAAELGVSSVDHLEASNASSAADVKAAGAVAGLLPASYLATFSSSRPPVDELRRLGVPIGLGTDFSANSLMPSMQTAIDLAIYIYGLTPYEAIAAATVNSAYSLRLRDRGLVAPGARADLVIWDLERVSELGYEWGHDRTMAVIKDGALVRSQLG